MTAVPFPTMRSEQLAATARFILRFYFSQNATEPIATRNPAHRYTQSSLSLHVIQPVATRNPACRYTQSSLSLHAAALSCYTLNTFHTL